MKRVADGQWGRGVTERWSLELPFPLDGEEQSSSVTSFPWWKDLIFKAWNEQKSFCTDRSEHITNLRVLLVYSHGVVVFFWLSGKLLSSRKNNTEREQTESIHIHIVTVLQNNQGSFSPSSPGHGSMVLAFPWDSPGSPRPQHHLQPLLRQARPRPQPDRTLTWRTWFQCWCGSAASGTRPWTSLTGPGCCSLGLTDRQRRHRCHVCA